MAFNAESIDGHNICVIWVDDLFDVHTWRDAYGVRVHTPNMDRLLDRGVRFSNAYATVPLCSPCRAELATGLSPFRTGLVDLNRIWREALPPETGWAYDLRRAGFYNFTTGKVDGKYEPMSAQYRRILFHEEPRAFDSGGKRSKVQKYLANDGPKIWGANHPDDDGSQDKYFYDHHVAQNAIDFLERADPARRHLIQLGFKHPHVPYYCPDRFYQLYKAEDIKWPDSAHPDDLTGPVPGTARYERSYIANGPWIPEHVGEDKWREVVRGYFAAISHMDFHLGRFLDALEASPFARNTTVVFLSDNGFNLGTHDSFHKMSQWDSAAHIPLGIWHAQMKEPQVIDLPVSLHNFPKTIMQLAGVPPRDNWVSGQSLLPLIDPSFGRYDHSKSPVSAVFGTLSVRPSVEGMTQYRYFRYPSGEEHVYDLAADPGEIDNIVKTAPLKALRDELVRGALELGLDLRGAENPADGVNAMMAVDGSVVLAGTRANNDYWVYGADAEKIKEDAEGGEDTLWYMGGPDDYVLRCPMNVEKIRIASVLARHEDPNVSGRKTIQVVAHPDSPIHFETSERVEVNVTGSYGNDIMISPAFGDSTFDGGAGNDQLISVAKRGNMTFYGGAGQDTLTGGEGDDYLDGGSGDDVIFGTAGSNTIMGGHGNDRITSGSGNSHITTGPGRNEVFLGDGEDTVAVGSGFTRVFSGKGPTHFQISYGGVTIINLWNVNQKYILVGWPSMPQISQFRDGVFDIALGLTTLRIRNVAEGTDLSKQIDMCDN